MVTRKAQQITSWSFSRYSLYRSCPAKAMYKFILKLPDPGSEAMQRGDTIHKLAEAHVKGEIKNLPAELTLFKEEFTALKKQKVKFIEESWTFKSDWSQTTWNDWNGAWLRVKLDVAYHNLEHNVLVPIDYKTGKYRDNKNEEYAEQLQLYALAGLKRFPDIDAVVPYLWYLDEGIIYPNPPEDDVVYERKDEKYLTKLWEGKVKKMLTDTTFKPTPGDACRFCPYSAAKNGPCRY